MSAIQKPNILIIGTPGVGKSLLSSKLSKKLGIKWYDISHLVKEKGFLEEYDDNRSILDEEKLLDYLEPIMADKGNIIDYDKCDCLLEEWFDAIFVLRCNSTILYDRLKERNYNEDIIKANIEYEISGTVLEEVKEFQNEEIIFELTNETTKDIDENIKKIEDWYKKWQEEEA